jgi:hypothetical protein
MIEIAKVPIQSHRIRWRFQILAYFEIFTRENQELALI